MIEPIPFHAWKDKIIAEDSKTHGCLYFRERSWYWAAYGAYCNKFRSLLTGSKSSSKLQAS